MSWTTAVVCIALTPTPAPLARRALLASTAAAALAPPPLLLTPAPALAADADTAAAGATATANAVGYDVPFRGEPTAVRPFLGKASLVVNVKFDDPATLDQLPGLTTLLSRYADAGLHVLAFPTDQGWFEADDSNTLRLKFKSVYGFGSYPTAVVFDKCDLVGGNELPLYRYLTSTLKNPWGVERLVLDYEKFLVDGAGRPLRRYPRKYLPQAMDADIKAALAGEELPPPPTALVQAWEDAKREAIKSEYSFKPGLNYYAFGSPAS